MKMNSFISTGGKVSLDGMLAVLQAAASQSEEESEVKI